MNRKIIITSISILITLIVIREFLRLLTGDLLSSAIIPGWSTTIHASEWSLTIGAFGVFMMVAAIIGMFRLIQWTITLFTQK